MSSLQFVISGTTYTIPGTWNNADNSLEVIGGGGGGGRPTNNTVSAGGGGGGAYSKISNVTVSGTQNCVIGAFGTGATSNGSSGGAGGDTWARIDGGAGAPTTTTQGLLAKGGSGGALGAGTPAGGNSASGVGTVKSSGGNSGTCSDASWGSPGGGGAAGPGGVGKNGGNDSASNTNNGGGGGGGNGGGGNSSAVTTNSGTAGGTAFDTTAGGAGGGASSNGTDGSHGSGGGGGGGSSAGTGTQGRGGNGSLGIDWDSSHGSGGGGGGGGGSSVSATGGAGGTGGSYGGGGGPGGNTASTSGNGGNGAGGILVLTWTPPTYSGVSSFSGGSLLSVDAAFFIDPIQVHYRFRTDAGAADATPTWGATEDQTYYPDSTNFRLRIGLKNAGSTISATPWELYVSKNNDAFTPVTTTIAKGVQSVDAGSSADDTQVLIPRLYPFSPDWMLTSAAVDLDFAGNRIYPISTAFTDYVSCSRASIGYARTADGVLTQFSSNQLRITDLGLLIEDARTNIILQSENFASASWSLFGGALTVTDGVSDPSGGTSADSLVTTVTTDSFSKFQQVSITGGSTRPFTWSVYAKQFSGDIGIRFIAADFANNHGYNLYVNLSDFSVVDFTQAGTLVTSGSSAVEQLANGWSRLSITATVDTSLTGLRLTCMMTSPANSTNTSFAGNGTSGFALWGAQIEEAAFVSSYIPTTTTSATRALDSTQLVNLALSLWNASAGTIIVKTNLLATGIVERLIGSSGGIFYIDTDGTLHETGGGNNATVNTSLRPSIDKAAYAWNTPNLSLVLNGGAVKTAADDTSHSGAAYLGTDVSGATPLYGYVSRLTLWNSKLADATLQSLTTL